MLNCKPQSKFCFYAQSNHKFTEWLRLEASLENSPRGEQLLGRMRPCWLQLQGTPKLALPTRPHTCNSGQGHHAAPAARPLFDQQPIPCSCPFLTVGSQAEFLFHLSKGNSSNCSTTNFRMCHKLLAMTRSPGIFSPAGGPSQLSPNSRDVPILPAAWQPFPGLSPVCPTLSGTGEPRPGHCGLTRAE